MIFATVILEVLECSYRQEVPGWRTITVWLTLRGFLVVCPHFLLGSVFQNRPQSTTLLLSRVSGLKEGKV